MWDQIAPVTRNKTRAKEMNFFTKFLSAASAVAIFSSPGVCQGSAATGISEELQPASMMRVYDLLGVVAPPDAKKPEIFARGNEDLEAFVIVQSEDVTAFSSAEREFDGPPTLKFLRGEQVTIPEGTLTFIKVADETGAKSDYIETAEGPTHFAFIDPNEDFDLNASY